MAVKIPVRKLSDAGNDYYPLTVVDSTFTNESIAVDSGSVGGYSKGDVIPVGTRLSDILKKLFSENSKSSNLTTADIDSISISDDNTKIPSSVAVKGFVNSSISASAACFVTKNADGDSFATKQELLNTTAFYTGGQRRDKLLKNDYCIVIADESHKQYVEGIKDIYSKWTTTSKYVGYYVKDINDRYVLVTVSNKDDPSLNIQPGTTIPYTSEDPTVRYMYTVNDTTGIGNWSFQYVVNTTPLTKAQINALNSGITSELVSKIGTIQEGGEVNVIESVEINGYTSTVGEGKVAIVNIPNATSTASGILSNNDKIKIDNSYGSVITIKTKDSVSSIGVYDLLEYFVSKQYITRGSYSKYQCRTSWSYDSNDIILFTDSVSTTLYEANLAGALIKFSGVYKAKDGDDATYNSLNLEIALAPTSSISSSRHTQNYTAIKNTVIYYKDNGPLYNPNWVVSNSYSPASSTTGGLMTKEDKIKLDGIETQANKYSLPIASSSVLGGIKIGNNLEISADGTLSAVSGGGGGGSSGGIGVITNYSDIIIPWTTNNDPTKSIDYINNDKITFIHAIISSGEVKVGSSVICNTGESTSFDLYLPKGSRITFTGIFGYSVFGTTGSSGVSKVNNKTGDITLYAGDIAISNTDATTIAAKLQSLENTLNNLINNNIFIVSE